MYDNLKSELVRAHCNTYNLAQVIHKSRQSVYSKLKNESEWRLSEMLAIQAYIKEKAPDRADIVTLDYLFKVGD